MRAVVQRVSQASVTGGGKTAEIGRGLCVLVGFESSDTEKERDALLAQLFKLKIFPAPDGGKPWSAGVRDIEDGGVLLVSQFTLTAALKSGKPSFHRAMGPEPAREMWSRLVEEAEKVHPNNVQSCVFGSMMHVHLVNGSWMCSYLTPLRELT